MQTGAPRPPWVLFTFQTTLDDSQSDKEECERYSHTNTAGHPHCDTHIKQQKRKIRVGIFCSYILCAYSILVYKLLWVILHLRQSKSNPWPFQFREGISKQAILPPRQCFFCLLLCLQGQI